MIRYSLYSKYMQNLSRGTPILGFAFDHVNREMFFADHWSSFPEEFQYTGYSTQYIPEQKQYLVQAYNPSVLEKPGLAVARFPTNLESLENIPDNVFREHEALLNRSAHGLHQIPFVVGQPLGIFLGEVILETPMNDKKIEPKYLLKILTPNGIKWVARPTWDY